MIKKCTCKHEYQDRTYGKGNRVMNLKQGKSIKSVKCTVCNHEHQIKQK